MAKFKNIDNEEHDARWLEAVNTFKKGDRAGALFLFKRLANDGCAPALIEVGNIYEIGARGIKKNIDEAKKWYLHAVEVIDDAKAHLALGRLYLTAGDSPSDFRNAHYHFDLLVDHNNHMGALYGLGLIYERGLGVDRDYLKAENYFQQSIDQGHVLAMSNLARIRLKKSFFEGLILLFKAFIEIVKVGYKDFDSPSLGIR